MRFFRRAVSLNCLAALLTCSAVPAQENDYENAPIHYSTAAVRDPVQKLITRLDAGDIRLTHDRAHGWLRSLLKALDVPDSSQTLVFSKTSLQFRRIGPSSPRALYFSDDVYVGWVDGGTVIELGAVDPQQGAVFYTVDQTRTDRPVIARDQGECLACHASARTQRVPGFLVRSVFPHENGQPDFRFGSETTDHTTPFSDRYGGWYVTGQHGTMTHRGNAVLNGETDDAELVCPERNGRTGLSLDVKTARYLRPTSDLVALMLLEHQTQFHNHVTRASFTARRALHQQQEMNRLLDRPRSYLSESTQRRIRAAAGQLVDYLLFCNEYRLTSPVSGSPEFRADFLSRAIRDREGRSLRDLDLQTRLLRYPCSYLVYSESFLALPEPVLQHVRRRMLDILSGQDDSEAYEHLSPDDRRAILEILQETHPLFS